MDPYRDIGRYYDCQHDDFEEDIEFYLNLIQSGPVLEVGCGSGRILARLADSGFEVFGVEPSQPMLERARQRLAGRERVHLINASADDFELARSFPVALLSLNTLSLAEKGSNGEVRLRFNADCQGRKLSGFSAAWDDEASQRLTLTLLYEELAADGAVRRTETQLTLRYLYRWELELLLRLAGFRVDAAYGGYDLEPYAASSPQILMVASAHG
jgi:SAM-dependent methyltransferase